VVAAGLGGVVLFVAVIAGAAAGVIDTALGATTASTGQTGGHSATTAPANGPLKTALVPAYLIPLFTGAAKNSGCGLTPALLAAQSQVESGYQIDAISSAGAVGIMQFLPSTWATEGIDGDHDGVASILDPADAIYSAAKLDCQNLDTIQTAGIAGDPIALMLAAYNAGLGAVQDCRCLPTITQTQNYVTEILRIAPTLATTPPPALNSRSGQMTYPMAVRAVVTQTYGPHAGGTFHPGIDLAAPAGTPVLAATNGAVTYAGWETGYGNYICLQETAVLSTCYAHLAVITVTLGESVTARQQLGLEGATGDATGPHLHFEVRINGKTVDPAPYLPST
jgi:murein DD-endopeptidase MepM/ murein hydrolase activator NlpD